MARRAGPVRGLGEALLHRVGQLGQTQDVRARRDELDREREAVHATTDPLDRADVRSAQREVRRPGRRAQEQRARRGGDEPRDVVLAVRQGERRERERHLPVLLQPNPRRDQHLDAGRPVTQGTDQLPRAVQQALRAIEQQQRVPVGEPAHDRVERGRPGRAHRVTHRGEPRTGSPDRAHRYPDHPVGVPARELLRDGDGETRLAHTAGSGHRDDADALRQQAADGPQRGVAAEERARPAGQRLHAVPYGSGAQQGVAVQVLERHRVRELSERRYPRRAATALEQRDRLDAEPRQLRQVHLGEAARTTHQTKLVPEDGHADSRGSRRSCAALPL
ncbi:hypothetical protein OEB99_10695 [Actinotalea sp. M2MS4P-6]|nr:hypothetical protein [Actinotalea sp. M2MS4P-6]MCV2394776.1 hypothetical protein [Actinotalea sp. M2MS4P-6]